MNMKVTRGIIINFTLLIRIMAILGGFYGAWSESYEIITPLSSFKRLKEGLYLLSINESPYAGSAYHQPPLLLALFKPLEGVDFLVYDLMFLALDYLCGHLIYLIAKQYYAVIVPEDVKEGAILGNEENREVLELPIILKIVYLANPVNWVAHVARSTSVFANIGILSTLLFALYGNGYIAAICCAIAAYLDIYPLMILLFIPGIVKRVNPTKRSVWFGVIFTFFLTLALLFAASYYMLGSWEFLRKSYGFMLLVDSMQPNIGIFWYFLAEMFESFRTFFVFVFQAHVFLYTIPLLLFFPKHPVFSAWMTIAISATFKAYPSTTDIAIYMHLIPLFYHKLQYLQHGFLVAATYLYLLFLYPIIWKTWIWFGTGNANFYYALNLVTALVNSLLITDSFDAIRKRDFLIKRKQKSLQKYVNTSDSQQ